MKTRAIIWSLKLVAATWAFAAAPASAGLDSLIMGPGFNVGGVELQVAYGQRGLQGPTYYFAASAPLGEHAPLCTEHCLQGTEVTLHHKSCPALLRHLAEHGFSVDYLVANFGPILGVGYSAPRGHRSSYRGFSNSYGVPAEHVAPAGSCRIWYPGRPPGHQPPPVDCLTARQNAPPQAWVIYDGPVFSGH